MRRGVIARALGGYGLSVVLSGVVSLLVIPVVYTYVDDVEKWMRRQIARVRGHQHPPQAAEGDANPAA